MARVLSIDWGAKRTGLAWTDPQQIIATPIGSVPTADLIKTLEEKIKEGPVECIVIGYPRKTDLTDSHSTQAALQLFDKLKLLFSTLKVELYDERFTSKIAARTLSEAGISYKKKKEKQLINSVSAVLILQDYLQYKS